jgi:hypothetical protein
VGRACGTHGREKCTGFWWESQKERDHSEDQDVDGIRMNLKEIGCGGLWSGFRWPRIGTDSDSCEDGNVPSGSSARDLVTVPLPSRSGKWMH